MKTIYKGLVCLFAWPILSVLSIGLMVCSIIAVIGGIARTFNPNFQMDLWNYGSVPSSFSIPVSILMGGVLLLIGVVFWKLLMQSIHFVKS